MTFRLRQLRGILPAVAILSLTASTPIDEPECVKADRWIEANRSSLPTTFAALAEFSPVYQWRIIPALPLNTQEELWRQHLSGVRGSVSLNVSQVQVVDLWLTRLPEFFDPSTSVDERRARVQSTIPLIETHFPDGLRQHVFHMQGMLANAKSRISSPATATECNCVATTKCKNMCVTGGCTSRLGCGEGGFEPCNGTCELDETF